MNGKYLVDTNVIIRLLNSDQHSVELFDIADEIYIPVIVAGELYYGAETQQKNKKIRKYFPTLFHNIMLLILNYQSLRFMEGLTHNLKAVVLLYQKMTFGMQRLQSTTSLH